MRPGTSFRVALKAESRFVFPGQPLQRAVEQRDMRGAHGVGQAGRVHRKTVVLAGDGHAAAIEVFDRVIGAVMAEFHLEALASSGQPHDLMAEANAEGRHIGGDDALGRGNGVIAGFGVARAVGEEHAVGPQRQHVGGRGLRGHHGDAAAACRQQAQDVELHAEVVGHDMTQRLGHVAITSLQRPVGLRPLVGLRRGDDAGQIQTGQTGKAARAIERRLNHGIGDVLPRLQGNDAAALRALGAQVARQPAGVDPGDGDRPVLAQIGVERLFAAIVRHLQRQILDDQPGGMHLGRFHVLCVGADVADMRISQGDDLAAVAGIGQDFLIAGHRGVEHHFANRLPTRANGKAAKDRAVGENQNGFGQHGQHENSPVSARILEWIASLADNLGRGAQIAVRPICPTITPLGGHRRAATLQAHKICQIIFMRFVCAASQGNAGPP